MKQMPDEEQKKRMSQLIAKCWADDAFKQKLFADPLATMRADGIELEPGLTIRVVENTEKLVHLVIPARPTELSDEYLDAVSGGTATAGPGESSPSQSSTNGIRIFKKV